MRGLKQLFSALWHGTSARDLGTGTAGGFLVDPFFTVGGAGNGVSADGAMRISAVWACVRIISEAIATLPLVSYKRKSDDTRVRLDDGVARLLSTEPSQIVTRTALMQALVAQTLVYGNGHQLIVRNNAGEPVELLPVHTPNVARRYSKTLGFVYTGQIDFGFGYQKDFAVSQADIIHVPGLTLNGYEGLSPVRYAAQSMGLALAAEEYGAKFFSQGSTPAGFISIPGAMTAEQLQVMRDQWQQIYGGSANSNKTAVLANGGTFERISIPPGEAQFIETRKHQAAEIARWFQVPPHMIGHLDRATYNNITHQQIDFVVHTLRPWLVRIEEEFNRKLFPTSSEGKPSNKYCEFNVEGLLRGDVKTRYEAYRIGRQWGWISANEIRAKENMAPIEGGDVFLSPMNMVDASDPPQQAEPAQDPAAQQDEAKD